MFIATLIFILFAGILLGGMVSVIRADAMKGVMAPIPITLDQEIAPVFPQEESTGGK